MTEKMREHVERQIIRRVILDAKAAGYEMNINNGGDTYELERPTNKVKTLMDAMFATGYESLVIYKNCEKVGWFDFIHGNGADIISDYSIKIEPLLEGAMKLADRYN